MSVMKFFCGNRLRVKTFGSFRKGASSLMHGRILNVTLSEDKVSTTGFTHGNLELLHLDSPASHQAQIQEDENLD